jgi:hypothetical protein
VYKRDRSRGQKITFERSRISRARFLRMIGTGAGLSLLPASAVALDARPVRAQAGSPTPPEILTDERFPIGIWWPPPPVNTGDRAKDLETTRLRYARVAAANFNFVIGGNGVGNDRANNLALEALELNNVRLENDVRLVLQDFELQNLIDGNTSLSAQGEEEEPPSVMREVVEDATPDTFSSAAIEPSSLQDRIARRIQHLKNEFGTSPALAGINLYDEPHKRLFGRLEFAKNGVLKQFVGQELPYINVWPSYASPKNALGAKTYADYLRAYRAQVNPPVLCFDHYPLLSKGITPDYYYNWSVIRNLSLQKPAIPFWGIIQSLGFDGRNMGLARRRTPTAAELFWQVNVGLAYGAKGIIYFTYWTPKSDRLIKFQPALVERSGATTPRYRFATSANAYLVVIGGVLKPLVSNSVSHAGVKRLPRGAAAFKPDGYVRAVSGSPVILGMFASPTGGNERHLLVVNRSSANRANTRVTLSDAVTSVTEISERDGQKVERLLTGTRSLSLTMDAGRAQLFRLRTG